jgi:hypothetical protein
VLRNARQLLASTVMRQAKRQTRQKIEQFKNELIVKDNNAKKQQKLY